MSERRAGRGRGRGGQGRAAAAGAGPGVMGGRCSAAAGGSGAPVPGAHPRGGRLGVSGQGRAQVPPPPARVSQPVPVGR